MVRLAGPQDPQAEHREPREAENRERWIGAPGILQHRAMLPSPARSEVMSVSAFGNGEDWRGPAHGAGLSAVFCAWLYLGILAAFALPFVSVSCSSASTREMSGWDLVLGNDTGIPHDADATDRKEVEEAVGAQRSVAIPLAAGATVLALGCLAAAIRPRRGLAVAVALGSLLEVLAFVTDLSAGQGTPLGPTVHHLGGYWLAAGAGVAASGIACVQTARMGVRLSPWKLIGTIVGFVVAALGAYGFGLIL